MSRNPVATRLLWFVLIGASLFALDAYERSRHAEIVVDSAVVTRIAALWFSQMQREPTPAELDALVRDWVKEEMLYREAKRLQLDRDDIIVRRRLVQKINFVAEADIVEPDSPALAAYYEAHKTTYLLPIRYSFVQVYFRDPADAAEIGTKLKTAGVSYREVGENGMMNPETVLRSGDEIQTIFGKAFVEALSLLSVSDDWQGPVKSEFGWHFIRLTEKRAPESPDFAAVRNLVLNDYLYSARESARQVLLTELAERYEVRYELPD